MQGIFQKQEELTKKKKKNKKRLSRSVVFARRTDVVSLGVYKTRNMEHAGTFRNIPEHPGT